MIDLIFDILKGGLLIASMVAFVMVVFLFLSAAAFYIIDKAVLPTIDAIKALRKRSAK